MARPSELSDLITDLHALLRDERVEYFGLAERKKKVLSIIRHGTEREFFTEREVRSLGYTAVEYYTVKGTNEALGDDFGKTYFGIVEKVLGNDDLFKAIYQRINEMLINSLDHPKRQAVSTLRASIQKETGMLRDGKGYFYEYTFDRLLRLLEPDKAHGRRKTTLDSISRPRGIRAIIERFIPDAASLVEQLKGLQEQFRAVYAKQEEQIKPRYDRYCSWAG